MRQCANPLVPTVLAGSFAAAVMVVGTTGAVSAASECIEKPNLQIDQAGHWYYRVDRIQHRRCWYFLPSEVTSDPPASPEPAPSPNADSKPSWFSRFTAAWEQTVSSRPQQNSAPQNNTLEDSGTAPKALSPTPAKTNKITRKERSQMAPPPETNGVASAERNNQPLSQSAAEKNEQHAPQLTPGDREALFQEFLKWYVDRSIFGRP